MCKNTEKGLRVSAVSCKTNIMITPYCSVNFKPTSTVSICPRASSLYLQRLSFSVNELKSLRMLSCMFSVVCKLLDEASFTMAESTITTNPAALLVPEEFSYKSSRLIRQETSLNCSQAWASEIEKTWVLCCTKPQVYSQKAVSINRLGLLSRSDKNSLLSSSEFKWLWPILLKCNIIESVRSKGVA